MTVFMLDLESLGLDPADPIVEIGILAVTDDMQTELGSFEALIDVGPEAWSKADPFARQMHAENGLLAALGMGFGRPESEVRLDVMEFLLKHGGEPPKRGYRWGGSGVNHYDSGVLALQWPEVRILLYYRADYDVSAPRGFAELAGRTDLPDVSHLVAHRALNDCRISWAQAKWILDILRPAA